jgi:hypothetical protein
MHIIGQASGDFLCEDTAAEQSKLYVADYTYEESIGFSVYKSYLKINFNKLTR